MKDDDMEEMMDHIKDRYNLKGCIIIAEDDHNAFSILGMSNPSFCMKALSMLKTTKKQITGLIIDNAMDEGYTAKVNSKEELLSPLEKIMPESMREGYNKAKDEAADDSPEAKAVVEDMLNKAMGKDGID